MFFEYNQNNSGGSFDVDSQVCHRVIIEANDKDDAYFIAQSKGIYFNGVHNGKDCECCGDRWSPQDEPVDLNNGSYTEHEAKKLADKYGAKCVKATRKYASYTHDVVYPNIESYAQYLADTYGWTSPDARIFYKDGTIKEVFKGNEKGN